MPSWFGILMSLMTTSYRALLSFLMAASPEVTVSMRCPSLRSEIKMPNHDGIEVLRHTRKASPETSVILITAVEDYEAAVNAVNAGAFQYIHKGPGLVEEIRVAVTRALDTISLRRENFAFKRAASTRTS